MSRWSKRPPTAGVPDNRPASCRAPDSRQTVARPLTPPALPRLPSPTCSFLLQLALLDLECSGHAPSLLAAAALSVSLEAFDKESWPAALQQFGSYLPADLAAAKARLVELQASQVRGSWAGQRAWSVGMLVVEIPLRAAARVCPPAHVCRCPSHAPG